MPPCAKAPEKPEDAIDARTASLARISSPSSSSMPTRLDISSLPTVVHCLGGQIRKSPDDPFACQVEEVERTPDPRPEGSAARGQIHQPHRFHVAGIPRWLRYDVESPHGSIVLAANTEPPPQKPDHRRQSERQRHGQPGVPARASDAAPANASPPAAGCRLASLRMARRSASDFDTCQRRARSSSARTDSTSSEYVDLMVGVAMSQYGHTILLPSTLIDSDLTTVRHRPGFAVS